MFACLQDNHNIVTESAKRTPSNVRIQFTTSHFFSANRTIVIVLAVHCNAVHAAALANSDEYILLNASKLVELLEVLYRTSKELVITSCYNEQPRNHSKILSQHVGLQDQKESLTSAKSIRVSRLLDAVWV